MRMTEHIGKKIPIGSVKTGKKTGIEKKNRTQGALRWLAGLLFAAVLGLLLELCFNLPAIRAVSGGGQASCEIPFHEIVSDGFEERDGKLVLTGESGYLHIPLSGAYVGKFVYSYEYEGLLNASVKIGVRNIYGESRELDAVMTEDRNSRVLHTSWIPVGKRADYADIYVTRDMLRESGLSYLDFDSWPLSFTGFETLTIPAVNGLRLFFFWCASGLLLLLCFGRELAAKKIEVGFLLISISAGTLFSLSLPANKVSWDEEVHFSQSFWMANYRNPVHVSPAILQEFSAGIDTWPYNQPGSREEQEALSLYLDTEGDYHNGAHIWSTDLNKTTMTGYVGQAVFLKLGQLFNLPFSLLFKLGRLGNLYLYCIVMYFAIKRVPAGKAIMAFLGLMPEPLLLAGVYSYDPTVTAFLYLSFAYMLRAVLEPEKKVTWKEYGVMVLAFFWGCRIKAVYAPLILVGLLIPGERFRTRQERLLMKAGMILLCILLMLSFVLPVLIAPRDIGDVRGNNTSEIGQMSYILGQPFSYAWILLCNMVRTLPSYVLGENSLGLLGHQGTVSCPWLLYAGSSAVILTAGQSSCGKRLNGKQKLWIFLLSGASAVLVWTSMYIAFTTPGNTYIDGVQGRYYMPFLFLIWLVLNPQRVTVHLKNEDYNGLVLALGGGILLAVYWFDILSKFCL